jgi:hypothetical protein
MQNVYVLQLQGTGDNETAWENAGVFATQQDLEKKLREINVDYEDADEAFFRLFDNARMEIWWLEDSEWGY